MIRSPALVGFVAGALAVGFGVAALFFLRFWRRAGEGLFLAFAFAFGLMALSQAFQILACGRDWDIHVYGARLAAFGLIILAILLKNLPRRIGR